MSLPLGIRLIGLVMRARFWLVLLVCLVPPVLIEEPDRALVIVSGREQEIDSWSFWYIFRSWIIVIHYFV